MAAIINRHTDSVRLAGHRHLERVQTPRDYFGPGGLPAPGVADRMRLVTFAVSIYGALGTQAQTLIDTVDRRCGRSLPGSLLDEASWAASSFAPYARTVLTLTVRRSLAMAVTEALCSEEEAARCFDAAVVRAAQQPGVRAPAPPPHAQVRGAQGGGGVRALPAAAAPPAALGVVHAAGPAALVGVHGVGAGVVGVHGVGAGAAVDPPALVPHGGALAFGGVGPAVAVPVAREAGPVGPVVHALPYPAGGGVA